MVRYEAYIRKDWREAGQAYVVAARLRDNGRVELGALLLDLWCLGVRDAVFVDDYSDAEFREALQKHLPDDQREAIHPAAAKKLVEGAVDYAQKLGFAPHHDYKKARRVFNGVDAATCTEIFTYGKDGKPMFISGESFSQERSARVLAILEARCGKDGFHYICQAADPHLPDEGADARPLRKNLQQWLDSEPDSVPRFFEVSGLITAMQLCPQVIMPGKLMEVPWRPKGRHWNTKEELQDFMSLLMAYWNEVSVLVADSLSPDCPPDETCIDVSPADFAENDTHAFTLAVAGWAAGFVRATELWPEAWGDSLDRPDLAPHWELIRYMADIDSLEAGIRLAKMARESPPRLLGPSVMALARALRSSRT